MSLQTAYRGGDAQGRPGWYIGFTYDADQVEALKKAVPHTERNWDPHKKLWWISGNHEDVILQLFPEFEAHLSQQELFA